MNKIHVVYEIEEGGYNPDTEISIKQLLSNPKRYGLHLQSVSYEESGKADLPKCQQEEGLKKAFNQNEASTDQPTLGSLL